MNVLSQRLLPLREKVPKGRMRGAPGTMDVTP
jgi:hypothetical protein